MALSSSACIDRVAWTRKCLTDAASGRAHPSVFRRASGDNAAVSAWQAGELTAAFGSTIVDAAILGSRLDVPDTPLRLPLKSLLELIGREPPQALIYLRQWASVAWPEGLRRAAELLRERFALPRARNVNLWIGASGVYTPTHVDDDDNFVIALQGRKRFIVYPPCGRGISDSMSPVASADRSGLVFVLHPGDAFFLPAGWMHHALAWDPSVAMNVWVSRR